MKKRLTALMLSALRPSTTPYYVADEQQAGLRVRVGTNGTLTWNVAYRVKGDPNSKSLSLGVCDPKSREGLGLGEARDRAAEFLKAARQGRNLQEEETAARIAKMERLSVADLIGRYAKHIKSPHRKGGPLRTASEIESRLMRALAPKLDASADSLRRVDISELLEDVANGRPREAEKRRQVIGAMYRWGLAKGYASNDPTGGTESYGRGDLRDRALVPDEIRAVWSWLEQGADRMPVDCIKALKLQFASGRELARWPG